MSFSYGAPSPVAENPGTTCVDALVIKVFRCAMEGFSSGETHCWDIGWRSLGEAMSAGDAGPLFGHFYGFARALLAVAQKPLAWRPASCHGLCHEEALAMRMIETAQRSDYVGTLEAASMLLGVDELGDALQAAQSLSTALTRNGLIVGFRGQGEPCGFDLCPHRRLN